MKICVVYVITEIDKHYRLTLGRTALKRPVRALGYGCNDVQGVGIAPVVEVGGLTCWLVGESHI